MRVCVIVARVFADFPEESHALFSCTWPKLRPALDLLPGDRPRSPASSDQIDAAKPDRKPSAYSASLRSVSRLHRPDLSGSTLTVQLVRFVREINAIHRVLDARPPA